MHCPCHPNGLINVTVIDCLGYPEHFVQAAKTFTQCVWHCVEPLQQYTVLLPKHRVLIEVKRIDAKSLLESSSRNIPILIVIVSLR